MHVIRLACHQLRYYNLVLWSTIYGVVCVVTLFFCPWKEIYFIKQTNKTKQTKKKTFLRKENSCATLKVYFPLVLSTGTWRGIFLCHTQAQGLCLVVYISFGRKKDVKGESRKVLRNEERIYL